jgi:hypothetical protein
MTRSGLVVQRLLALFVAGWLLFDFPLLRLWQGGGTLMGVPLLPAMLFAGWALVIGVLAWLMERGGDDD